MPLPCEFAVKSIIPAFRALIAKELIEYYRLKQENVAGLLGVTQPAVSQYTRNIRGKTLDLDKIESIRLLAKGLAANLVNNSLSLKEINQNYCAACTTARKKRIICELHKQLDPSFNTEDCDACQTLSC
ncbi:MAG: hypothetical protein JSV20_08710 [Candidatus Bathyarchaeota archaeon]|nr:MAG: hypothetical protein JSV20_08710 [Candidatus Bathyarchaeota archaeon]